MVTPAMWLVGAASPVFIPSHPQTLHLCPDTSSSVPSNLGGEKPKQVPYAVPTGSGSLHLHLLTFLCKRGPGRTLLFILGTLGWEWGDAGKCSCPS